MKYILLLMLSVSAYGADDGNIRISNQEIINESGALAIDTKESQRADKTSLAKTRSRLFDVLKDKVELGKVEQPMYWLNFSMIILVLILLFGIVFYIKNKFIYLEERILQKIKSSVEPKFIEISLEVKSLAKLAIEVWRLQGYIQKNEENNNSKGIKNSLQKIQKFLEEHDIEIQDFTDKTFNDGMNVDVLSIVKEDGKRKSTIKETVEPSIFSRGKLINKAKIIIIKGEQSK